MSAEITIYAGDYRRFSVAQGAGEPRILNISDGTTELHLALSSAQLRVLRDVIDAALEAGS